MSRIWLKQGLGLGALLGLTLALATPADAKPRPGAKRRALNLFAGVLNRQFVNRFDCGLNAAGEVCVDPNGSTTVGGGFWPKGSPNQYVFNSGLQLAGIVENIPGFAWASDTVGAFFFDPKGTTEHGERITLVFSSLDAGDLNAWPRDAYVPSDTGLFNAALFGLKAASQQDTWVQYWDGNPANNAGRLHPLGVLVTQRGLAWTFPVGNEDIIYFLYTFTNVTARNAAVYAGLPNKDSLEAIGARFQSLNEGAFGVAIPDGGYTINQLYAAFAMDADVSTSALENYASAFLPFSMGTAFKRNWFDQDFVFPPDVYGKPGQPFAYAPGAVGVKYLKSPKVAGVEVGLTMFSNTINGGQFDDAQNTTQLWRYLSAGLDPLAGDAPCNDPRPGAPAATKVCFVSQTSDDVRFFQSSGPLSLAPGESQTIVVAYLAAAPVDVPAIAGRGQAFDLKPDFPALATDLATGADTLRSVDRVFGAVSVDDTSGDGTITQDEVTTVPGSLLDKAFVAQTIFDTRFLLPFPPAPPPFVLVPGDNQVTVAWQESPTEQIGDPFFALAGNPTNPLYDPNYVRVDVEGYRIYRGRTQGDLDLVVQFDKAGSQILDFTAAFNYGNCAPELGITTDCPPDLATGHAQPLVGNVVQINKRVELADGSVLVTQADTALISSGLCTAGDAKCSLRDTGVPFVYVDRAVSNSFTYYYLVTAFDVNSLASTGLGNTALESGGVPETVVPRKPASNVSPSAFQLVFWGDDGVELSSSAPYPTIDAATGTFSGNMPPVNGGLLSVDGVIAELLLLGEGTVVVDSVTAGFTGGIGAPPVAHLRFMDVGRDTVRVAVPLPEPGFPDPQGTTQTFSLSVNVMNKDTGLARVFGVSPTGLMPLFFFGKTVAISDVSGGIAVTAGRFGVGSAASRFLGHSRWFDEGGQEPPDPTIMGVADTAHNSGRLTGVGRMYAPQAYRNPAPAINNFLRGYSYGQATWYPADFVVTWNADSSISVRDVTHHVALPFTVNGGTGWGFVNLRAYTAAGVTTPELEDLTGTPDVGVVGYHHIYATQPTCYPDWWFITCVELENKAEFQPIDFGTDGVADANGIALSVNGEIFLMEMNALPAAGTRWHLRAVTGKMGATCTPGFGPVMTDCSSYTFTGPATRASLVPNLRYTVRVTQQYAVDNTSSGDLSRIHTVPDPYYGTNAYEQSPNIKQLRFVNLPNQCIVRIYSLSGILVQALTFDDASGGGELEWNLRNRNQQFVASGVYFYHVETRDGKSKIGKFTVVNFAQ